MNYLAAIPESFNFLTKSKEFHLVDKNNKCPHCHTIMANSWYIKHHIKAVHEKLEPFQCDQCFGLHFNHTSNNMWSMFMKIANLSHANNVIKNTEVIMISRGMSTVFMKIWGLSFAAGATLNSEIIFHSKDIQTNYMQINCNKICKIWMKE